MKFVPKEIENNVNVSKNTPIRDFFMLLGALFGIILGFYILLGLGVELLAPRMPAGVEQKLGNLYEPMFPSSSSSSEKQCQQLLDSLQKYLPEHDYHVSVIAEEQVNAFAIPGKRIVLFSELIRKAESENELAFVLGHELGHFAHKDHLKGLGRQLVLFAFSVTLLGNDNSVTNLLSRQLTNVEMKFSRDQEVAADLFALKLLDQKYGHVAGATDFFSKLAQEQKMSKFSYYFATHPHPESRIKRILQEVEQKNYQLKTKTKLNKEFIEF